MTYSARVAKPDPIEPPSHTSGSGTLKVVCPKMQT